MKHLISVILQESGYIIYAGKKNNTQIERLRSIDEEKVSISRHLFGEMQHFLCPRFTG